MLAGLSLKVAGFRLFWSTGFLFRLGPFDGVLDDPPATLSQEGTCGPGDLVFIPSGWWPRGSSELDRPDCASGVFLFLSCNYLQRYGTQDIPAHAPASTFWKMIRVAGGIPNLVSVNRGIAF